MRNMVKRLEKFRLFSANEDTRIYKEMLSRLKNINYDECISLEEFEKLSEKGDE